MVGRLSFKCTCPAGRSFFLPKSKRSLLYFILSKEFFLLFFYFLSEQSFLKLSAWLTSARKEVKIQLESIWDWDNYLHIVFWREFCSKIYQMSYLWKDNLLLEGQLWRCQRLNIGYCSWCTRFLMVNWDNLVILFLSLLQVITILVMVLFEMQMAIITSQDVWMMSSMSQVID